METYKIMHRIKENSFPSHTLFEPGAPTKISQNKQKKIFTYQAIKLWNSLPQDACQDVTWQIYATSWF